jgi:periplasmic mercuric ion binding protein
MMKTLLAMSLLTALLFLQTVHAETSVPAQAQNQNTNQSVTLELQNMTCAMCKFTIKKALQGVDGVDDANVDYDTKTAKVIFNALKTNADALIKASTDAGYPATVRKSGK